MLISFSRNKQTRLSDNSVEDKVKEVEMAEEKEVKEVAEEKKVAEVKEVLLGKVGNGCQEEEDELGGFLSDCGARTGGDEASRALVRTAACGRLTNIQTRPTFYTRPQKSEN